MTDYVFNSASLSPVFARASEARAELAELLRGLAILDGASGSLPALRSAKNLWITDIAVENGATITVGDVAQQLFQFGEHEAADFFFALNVMSPVDANATDDIIDEVLAVEVTGAADGHKNCYDRAKLAGMDAVYCVVSDGLLIGFSRDGRWDIDHLAFRSNTGDLRLDHTANQNTANKLAERRLVRQQEGVTARSFWVTRADAFPSLLFGLDVERQIAAVDSRLLGLLFARLADLNDRAEIWKNTGDFPSRTPVITGETEATMNRYGSQRSFRDEHGGRAIFEEHMWVDRSFRIHLIRRADTREVCVGYIGRHLSTINFPT